MIVVAELARDVQLVPGDPGSRDRLTYTALVAVALREVDVSVSELEGEANDLSGLLGVLPVRSGPGGTFRVPKPICGIVVPWFSAIRGESVMLPTSSFRVGTA